MVCSTYLPLYITKIGKRQQSVIRLLIRWHLCLSFSLVGREEEEWWDPLVTPRGDRYFLVSPVLIPACVSVTDKYNLDWIEHPEMIPRGDSYFEVSLLW